MTIVPVALPDSVPAVLHVAWESEAFAPPAGVMDGGEGARDSA